MIGKPRAKRVEVQRPVLKSDARFPTLGAIATEAGTTFRVWSTSAKRVSVRLHTKGTRPLAAGNDGIFEATFADVGPGDLYTFLLDDTEARDPYARFLPQGVNGPAEVIAPTVSPALENVSLERLVLYELHVGTFTNEGTYRAAAERLPYLADLGVTAIELMPLASFPGERGWGYDGVASFAPFEPYGRPEDLRDFIAKAHGHGLAVILDVVYNHFGPRGNVLGRYSASYFDPSVNTPWGAALSFATPAMRGYVLANVRMWLEYGFDGLRLDATHAMVDASESHILKEISSLAHACVPPRLVIAEDDRNDQTLVTQTGLDAIWADDFHHQVHVLLTGERDGYYASYAPTVEALAQVIERGWDRGKPADDLELARFVYCIQNHDQVGNRAYGTRLSQDAGLDAFRVVTALLGFLPMTPLLFMGQEWGASTPFLYFTDHEEDLGKLISKGRRQEFGAFRSFQEEIPDPQDRDTFLRSKLRWEEREEEPFRSMLETTREIFRARKTDPVLSAPASRSNLHATAREGNVLVVERSSDQGSVTLAIDFAQKPIAITFTHSKNSGER